MISWSAPENTGTQFKARRCGQFLYKPCPHYVLTKSTISGSWHSNVPRPSSNLSLRLRGKIWEWPGDEANSHSLLHTPSLPHTHTLPPSLPSTLPQMPWASRVSLVRAVWRWGRKGGSTWKPSNYATLATSSIATACSFSCAFLASGTILCTTTRRLFLRSSKMWVGFVSPSQESWSVRIGNETGMVLYRL